MLRAGTAGRALQPLGSVLLCKKMPGTAPLIAAFCLENQLGFFFNIYIYIYEQNGPCSHSCSLSKIFCHELVEKERFLAEIKGVTFKEGDSKKSGKDKRDVRICIGRSGEGRNRGRLHKCNVLGTYPSAL